MPRQSRQRSFSGIYHIMMRGNEKRNIFLDDEDRYKFIDILYNKKMLSNYCLYAYCLMSNHVHLLLKENDEDISLCLKRINISYACYFNKKYDRVGHLFQDRFRSECINSDSQLLSALRYIHNNPIKAKMVMHPEDYIWSSYNIYMDVMKNLYLIDRDEILPLFSSNKRNAVLLFRSFSNKSSEDSFIDYDDNETEDISIHGVNEAQKYVKDYLSKQNIDIGSIKDNIEHRNNLIAHLRLHSNLSIREIGNVLCINRGIVSRVKM